MTQRGGNVANFHGTFVRRRSGDGATKPVADPESAQVNNSFSLPSCTPPFFICRSRFCCCGDCGNFLSDHYLSPNAAFACYLPNLATRRSVTAEAVSPASGRPLQRDDLTY